MSESAGKCTVEQRVQEDDNAPHTGGVHPGVALAVFGLVLAADAILFRVAPPGTWMWLAGVTLALYVAAPVAVTYFSGGPVVRGTWLNRPQRRGLSTWLVIATALLVPAYIYLNLLLARHSVDVRRMIYGDVREMRRILRTTPWALALVGGLGFAFAEEVMFRGFLLKSLRRWGDGVALVVSSLCFAVAHHSVGKLAPMVIAGLWFGYVALRTRSVWISTLAHFVVNSMLLAAAVQLSRDERGRITLPAPGEWWMIAVVAAVTLTVFVTERFRKRFGAQNPAD